MSNFDDSLNTGAGQSFKFDAVGVKIVGEVLSKSMVNTTSLKTGEPEDVPVVTLHTDDGDFDVWLGKAALRGAIGKALLTVGPGTKLEVGGQLAVERIADGIASKPGYSAPHLFRAAYKPPARTAAAPAADGADATADDLFGDA